ncbi:unnamed protein product, partial [Scytosiphon promiscuus]
GGGGGVGRGGPVRGGVPRPGLGGARGDEQGGVGLGHPHLSAGMKAAMAFDVAKGMLHLHENGFLHGALKPKNVLVFDNLRLMVSDYGLLPVKKANDLANKSLSGLKQRAAEAPPPAAAGAAPVSTVAGGGNGAGDGGAE